MFYETKNKNHGLKYDPFKSCIIPRPIAWITTISNNGEDNCAPYSFFNGVASDPPMVMFANNGPAIINEGPKDCLLYTSPSPRDATLSRMPSSA